MDESSTNESVFGLNSIRNDDFDHREDSRDLHDESHLTLEGAIGEMEHKDSDSDGQRRMLNLDEDGGSCFEASTSQNVETVVRKGRENGGVNSAVSPGVSAFQEFLSNDSDDALFNPAQRLNFDDTTEDEEGNENAGVEEDELNQFLEHGEVVMVGAMCEGYVDEGEGDGDGSESEDGSTNYLDHRPRVNGSDLVEDGAVAAAVAAQNSLLSLNSVADQGQNVRIIEGHDSSLQDDDDDDRNPIGSNSLRFNANFMQTQALNLPSMSSLPSGRSHGDSDNEDNEDGHNLYDSLDPEDGTSPYRGQHTEHQVLDPNTSEYYSAGSLLSLQTLTSQQSQGDGDGESFWPQQEDGELSLHVRHSVPPSIAGKANSSQQESLPALPHPDAPSVNSSYHPDGTDGAGVSHLDQSCVKDRAVGSGGDGAGLVDTDFTSPGVSQNDSQDALELCEDGLMQGTQLYAQPMTSPTANENFESDIGGAASSLHKMDHPVNYSFHQSNANTQKEAMSGDGGGGIGSQANIGKGVSNSNQSNFMIATDSGSSLNMDSPAQSNTGGSSSNGSVGIVMDERQAAAGSSRTAMINQNQSAKPKVAKSTLVPRKRITTSTTKVQQTRRPAVQGSASREGVNRKMGSSSSSNVTSSSAAAALSNSVSISSSACATNNKTVKNASNITHSPPMASTNSMRTSTQGGDSAAVLVKGVAGTKNPGQNVGANQAASEAGSRLGYGGNPDPMHANAVSVNSKFSRTYQPHPSRTNSSYASMSSLTSASNSRISGVGKECHYSHRSGPAQSNSSNSLSQGSRYDQGGVNQTIGSGEIQQDKATRSSGVPSNHSLTGQENTTHANYNIRQVAVPSQVQQASSDHNVPISVNSGQLSSNSSSYHDITSASSLSSLLIQQQHQVRAHHQQQQQLHHFHQQGQDYINQQQQVQSPPSPSGSDQSHNSYNREIVVSQMDALQHRQPQRPSQPKLSQRPATSDQTEAVIPSMEEVRGHLHSMMNMAADRSIGGMDQTETATDLLTFDQPVQRQLHFDTDSTFNGTSGPEDMSEILENFPTFSSKMFTEMSGMGMQSSSNRPDTQPHGGENHYLRETLEKERYRRKHCEQQIQKLNAKLLETQQQLAVAVSTDKRKDLMIEQLDKQLARVVEGWKKREADKDTLVASLTEEKEVVEETLHQQQEMINNFERDLAQTVAELKEEKEKSSETIESLRSELSESRQMRDEVEMHLASAADKCNKMAAEWDTLTKAKVTAETLAQQTQDTLVEEEGKWKLKESDLINKINQVKEANQKVINMEKVKLEEEKKKREALETECGELKSELRKIVLDTEQLVREKESQKVEMSIMEAKFESAQRKLEADLHAQMEKEISEQAQDYHSRLETAMEEMCEKHRKQVADLHSRHQRDLEVQIATANQEMDKKDAAHKQKMAEMDDALMENRNEISNLKQSKLKLESQRMEILSKLQFMMQSQWNEAVSLLVSTPQKKGLSNSFLSNQTMSMSGMLANTQATLPPYDNANTTTTTTNQSLTTSLNLASLAMSTTSPKQPSPSQQGPMVMATSSSTAPAATTTSTTTAITTTTSTPTSTPPQDKIKNDYNTDVVRGKPFADKIDAGSCGSDGSSNNNTVLLGRSYASSRNSQSGSSVYNIQDRETVEEGGRRGGGVEYTSKGEEKAKMDRVEEYVFRTAIQGTNKTMTSPKQCQPATHPVVSSSQTSMTFAMTPNPGSSNPMLSAVVHHPSAPSTGFKAVPIKSPRQRSTSQFWNDGRIGPSYVSQEQGSCAPPPSAVNSFCSMTQDDQDHSTALVVNSSTLQQQLHMQHQHHHHHHHQQQQHNQSLPHRQHISQPPHQLHQSHPPQQQQQQQRQQQQQQQQRKEAPPPGNVWPPSLYNLNSLEGNHSQHTNGGTMSPPVRQPAMRREDLEESVTSEASSVTDPIRLQADYNHLTDQVDAHVNRQEELQHYIQMLLQKAPGSVELERDQEQFDILESSRDLTVDLDLTETGQALEMTRQMTRLQELREKQQAKADRNQDGLASKKPPQPTTSLALPANTTANSNASVLSDMGMGEGHVLTPQNLVDISQLLSLYREQWEVSPESATQANTAGHLMDALRKSQGQETNLNDTPHKVNTPAGSGGKNSPRGGHHKKSKNSSSSLSSSTASSSSTTNKDSFIRNRKKSGHQPSTTYLNPPQHTEPSLNASIDMSGHHHNHNHNQQHHGHSSGGGTRSGGASSTSSGGGRKSQGGGGTKGGALPWVKGSKSNGSAVWK